MSAGEAVTTKQRRGGASQPPSRTLALNTSSASLQIFSDSNSILMVSSGELGSLRLVSVCGAAKLRRSWMVMRLAQVVSGLSSRLRPCCGRG